MGACTMRMHELLHTVCARSGTRGGGAVAKAGAAAERACLRRKGRQDSEEGPDGHSKREHSLGRIARGNIASDQVCDRVPAPQKLHLQVHKCTIREMCLRAADNRAGQVHRCTILQFDAHAEVRRHSASPGQAQGVCAAADQQQSHKECSQEAAQPAQGSFGPTADAALRRPQPAVLDDQC